MAITTPAIKIRNWNVTDQQIFNEIENKVDDRKPLVHSHAAGSDISSLITTLQSSFNTTSADSRDQYLTLVYPDSTNSAIMDYDKQAVYFIPNNNIIWARFVPKVTGNYRLVLTSFISTSRYGYNRIRCNNYAPTATTNWTTDGTISVVSDTTEIANAGLDWLCTNGNVFKIDNSSGGSAVYAYCTGDTTNTNKHSVMVWARGSGTFRLGISGSYSTTTLKTLTSSYTRFEYANLTPSGTTDKFYLQVEAGAILYFILPQLEQATACYHEVESYEGGVAGNAPKIAFRVSYGSNKSSQTNLAYVKGSMNSTAYVSTTFTTASFACTSNNPVFLKISRPNGAAYDTAYLTAIKIEKV